MKNKSSYTIAVTNQKGGTGKTTTTINLGVALSKLGYKVLLVDNDKQTNLTTGLIIDENRYIYKHIGIVLDKVLENQKVSLKKYIIHTRYVDVVAGCRELHTYKKDFENRKDRNLVYKNLLDTVKYEYDYILIDCPPVAGIENAQAYTAADSILIVSEPSMYSLDGIVDAVKIVNDALMSENPKLNILGILINKVHVRRTEDNGYTKEIQDMCKGKFHVFKNIIPENAAVARCASLGKSILQHRSTSNAAFAFMELAKEVVREVEQYA